MTRELRPKRSGTIFKYAAAKPGEEHGHYVVRCSAPDGTRPLFHLDPSPQSPEHEAAALATAQQISAELWSKRLGAAPTNSRARSRAAGADDDAEKWIQTWLADRKRRGLVGHVDSDVRTYIRPFFGPKPVRDWTPDDLRGFCRWLDGKVQAGEMAWKTATNVWGTATRMCKDACRSKLDELRVRDDNPAAGVAGPDRGAKKAKQYLYPSEFLKFATCEDVPLSWRRTVAVAIYLYPRAAELRGLSLSDDVDLEHGVVHIHRSLDGDDNSKPTKTKTPRRFAIEPNVLPLLRMLASGAGIEMPAHEKNLSDILRKMLKKAGVARAELHETTATRKAITFHDLRSTGITWLAIRGDDPLKIMQRAGHSDFKTTQGYIREAEAVREGFGEVFPPLPACLLDTPQSGFPGDPGNPPEGRDSNLSRNLSQASQLSETTVRRRGLEPPWELPR